MKVDGGIELAGDAAAVAGAAAQAEDLGYDGVWTTETRHDPFLPLAVAAASTRRVQLGTSIAVGFARTPMTLAMAANDLQQLSGGRFVLGLGSQIKAHITKRYSMPWSHPAPRMRELVVAIRTIWGSWATGTPLSFRGDFYTHTLMTPVFDPGPNPHGAPPILVAAVGERMTEVAGEVADGLIVHPFTTEPYLREVTLRALERGASRSGRARSDLVVSFPGFVVTGTTDDEMAASARAARAQLAFYASTPAYRPVLEHHGWGDLQTELHRLSRAGAWEQMGALVDDTMLKTFAVVAPPEEVPGRVLARFGQLVDRFTISTPAQRPDAALWRRVLPGFAAR
ncbi:MAG TPA: LLM class F420-dependent oxidoreductase [Acidimicrobiales bacterium]|nr:LLM class F420-dependent oxidoreductase [Acidimicrobiales bacterium]